MLVANSFDLWKKDTFFAAAEEVQQSADIMESAYRTWLRARREGLMPEYLDALGRELQMALGTAKWQLEEFERAVCLSYRHHANDITISRHRQFVYAIEDQISHVETAFKESFYLEGKKPFCWVTLDEQECDDLALFLSGTSRTSEQTTDVKEDSNVGPKSSSKIQIPNPRKSPEEVVTSNEDVNCFVEQDKSLETTYEISYQVDRITSNVRNWSSPKRSTLQIVINMDDSEENELIEATPKEKGYKPFFWSLWGEEHFGAKGGVVSHTQLKMFNWINQRLRGGHRGQKQQLMSPVLPVISTRFILALMLTIFLVAPFLVYST